MAPRERPVVHIGLPRTGTTTLQNHLFARHPEIEFLGLYKGAVSTPTTRRLENCRDEVVHSLMNELLFAGFESPDFETSRSAWRTIRERAGDRLIVWSSERLSTDVVFSTHRRAQNLESVLGPVRIVMTLRNPITLMESCYFQILRRENRRHQSLGGRAWFAPIDEWFESSAQGEMAPLLDYEGTLNTYCKVFGEDAVDLLLFEDLEADQAGHVRGLCERLGIDPVEGQRLVGERIENATSRSLVNEFKLLSRVPGGAPIARFLARLNTMIPTRRATGLETRLNAANRRRIEDATRRSNRRISQRFGLDLESRGYAL